MFFHVIFTSFFNCFKLYHFLFIFNVSFSNFILIIIFYIFLFFLILSSSFTLFPNSMDNTYRMVITHIVYTYNCIYVFYFLFIFYIVFFTDCALCHVWGLMHTTLHRDILSLYNYSRCSCTLLEPPP